MTHLIVRGFSDVSTRSGNGAEAEMTPGGGTLTLRTRDVTMVLSTRDLVLAMFGVAHPVPADVKKLIELAEDEDDRELVEMLHVFHGNLTVCLRETDLP